MNMFTKIAATSIAAIGLLAISGCTVSSTSYSRGFGGASATSVSFGVSSYPYYRGLYPRYYRSGVYYRSGSYYRRGYHRRAYYRSGTYYRRGYRGGYRGGYHSRRYYRR